jgi:hypothetical protein
MPRGKRRKGTLLLRIRRRMLPRSREKDMAALSSP